VIAGDALIIYRQQRMVGFFPAFPLSRCLSGQINDLKINEIDAKREAVLGLRTNFLIAKKRFGLPILDFTVASNRIHFIDLKPT
jgi:hypothetical protein